MTQSLACAGQGIGAAWGTEMHEKFLNDAGFADVKEHPVDNKFSVFWLARRPTES
ncbi:hypothetical protein PYCC9005_005316 [Savitreella phatthalungensis]